MRKFFMSNGNEIKAFDSIEALKAHIEANYDMDAVEEEGLDIHSGIFDDKRYYGEGAEGTKVDGLYALDGFADWWNEDWDEEVYEM
jgi:hypothetical protein